MPTPTDDLIRRLNEVASSIEQNNRILERIRGSWAEPPDPDKPAVRTALSNVLSQAATATRLTNDLLGRL